MPAVPRPLTRARRNAQEAGIDLPYSCRAGACSSCAGKVEVRKRAPVCRIARAPQPAAAAEQRRAPDPQAGKIDLSDQSFLVRRARGAHAVASAWADAKLLSAAG